MSIHELVQKYEANKAAYRLPNYNEAQLRADFLDPLFELLGWDLKNAQGKPTNEREVLLEEPLKEDATSNTKKPDYTFRLFSERRFFLEAKKPSINIETDNDPAKQVRRYGYTAKLKISVLSNFEYLAIYDCSEPVAATDIVTKSRIQLYHYTEYESAFEEIKQQLSHKSVYSGEFDITWKDIEAQLARSSVDDHFLTQINEWRVTLGKEIYAHKNDLSDEFLNDIVQRYINSIIFLRVCEDRNLESYKTLLEFAEHEDYSALIKKFEEADHKYNARLFNHALTAEIITNNHSAFWLIINQLYFPESTYSFSVFSSDILGNIYEIFLGEQLKIVGGEVTLVKKPENEDRDIVTTPTFIIHNILKETVTRHCDGKSGQQILESSFADIACGSGAFLLETYQLLHDTLVDYYFINDKSKLIQTSIDTYKLKFDIKTQLLQNCVFGIDKDFNAVEACKFGLLLKLLENENNTSIPTPALPQLDDIIKYGNSLIYPNQTTPENRDQINPFNFADLKFDVIIGNPPYMKTEDMNKFTPLELPLYKRHFEVSFKQFDKYFLFIENAVNLLKPDGFFGYIVPSKFTKLGAGKNLRQFLSSKKIIQRIVSFGANQIFKGKTTYTCILTMRNQQQEYLSYIEISDINEWRVRNVATEDYSHIDTSNLNSDGWLLVPKHLNSCFESISAQSISLEELIGSDNIYNGIQTSANSIYIHTATNEDEDFYYFVKEGRDWKIEKSLTRPYFKTSRGTDNLDTYHPFLPNSFVIYPYIKQDGAIEFVPINILESDYPHTFAYLTHYQEKLSSASRDIKPEPETSDEWYRYGRHQSLDKCDVPAKIIVGVLSQGNKYAIDYHRTLISSGGTAGYCMITLPENSDYSVYYIQAILNSKYIEWYSSLVGEVFRGGYIARGTKVLKKLPIRIVDFSDTLEKELHDRIASLQEELIAIQGRIDQNIGVDRALRSLTRQFDEKQNELSTLLIQLFNLGEDDHKIPMISEIYAIN